MKKALLTILAAFSLAQGVSAQTAASFSIDTISDAVFARMRGRSFPDVCTVKRQDLRYLRVLHRNAQDSTLHGELVCNKLIAERLIDIFRNLYDAHYPIERIRLIDDYNADDELSMGSNNTSCFCFRTVAGSKSLSKHAQGLAIDINPLYNPCVRQKKDGNRKVEPAAGKAYVNRKGSFPYKLTPGDLCYRLFLQHGFQWGGNWRTVKDYQHFEFRQ